MIIALMNYLMRFITSEEVQKLLYEYIDIQACASLSGGLFFGVSSQSRSMNYLTDIFGKLWVDLEIDGQ